MHTIAVWFSATVLFLGVIASIAQIDKPRHPLSRWEAVTILVVHIIIFYALFGGAR